MHKKHSLQDQNWTTHFGWIKAHISILDNEMQTDWRREQRQNPRTQSCVENKETYIASYSDKEEGASKWGSELNVKAKGGTCKTFSTSIQREREREKTGNNIISELTAIVTRHEKITP